MSHASDVQATDHEETALLAGQVIALMAKATERFDPEDREEWQWLAQQSANPQIVELLRDMSLTTAHVINAIGLLEPVNGITISAQFRIPKGTVSKVTRRLIAQKLAISEYLPNNKKEILFRLTPLGRELFDVHRAFDGQMERGFNRFLQRYRPDELRLLIRVLEDAIEASFLTLGLESTSAEGPA